MTKDAPAGGTESLGGVVVAGAGRPSGEAVKQTDCASSSLVLQEGKE